MATLKRIPEDQVEITLRLENFDQTSHVKILARYKTWFGMASEILPHTTRYDYVDTPRYEAAVKRAIESLNTNISMTFRQLADLIE